MRARGVRRLQTTFALLLLICIAQVAWWLLDAWMHGRQVVVREEAQLERETAAAVALRDAGVPIARVKVLLPDVEEGPAGTLRPSPAVVARLESERGHRLRRYAWEGAFFLAVLMSATFVLVHALRREAEMGRRQQNFLASVSHEFKSPIASLLLDVGTLSLRDPPAEVRRRLVDRMGDTLARLEGMVANLLETARLEEGRFVQDPRDLRLAPALRTAAAAAQHGVAGRDIAVEVDVSDELLVRADDTAVDTVMRNLLENAMKSTEAARARHVPIKVVGRVEGRRVRVDVIDAGEGFDPGQADRLFEKFYRPGDEMKRAGHGSGLGLYIVRQLVERGGGRVRASSAGPGHGATFTVYWPRAEEQR